MDAPRAVPGSNPHPIAIFLAAFLAMTGCAHKQVRSIPDAAAMPEPPPMSHAKSPAPPSSDHSLRVTASAYNSLRSQTDALPTLAAWGDSLYPGLRAIAVSRDLIPLGLGWGAVVRIDGLPGEYKVLDKMDARWRKRIDVYFGKDVAGAKAWGEQKVVIRWRDSTAMDSAATPRTPS